MPWPVASRTSSARRFGCQAAFGAAQDSESWIDGHRDEGGYYLRAVSERARLEPPAIDGKVITGWNGLAIGALARAGLRLGEPLLVEAAAEAAEHVLMVNRGPDGRVVRTSLGGIPSMAAVTASDLALLADGLFALAAASGGVSWAVTGRVLLDEALAGVGGDPLLAAHGIAAAPDRTDGDLPSDSAAIATAALSAWRLGAGEQYRAAAAAIVSTLAARALGQPFAHGTLLRVAAGLAEAPRQVVAVTASTDGTLAAAVRAVDADVIAVVTPAQATAFAEAGFELFEGRAELPERVYDCRGFVCRLPVSDASEVVAER